MPKTIYDQLRGGLAQATRYGERDILYRGVVIPCAVLLGVTSTKLSQGGLEDENLIHVKILRSDVPIGQDGDPHTNENVLFPGTATQQITQQTLMIREVIGDEVGWSLTLTDPSK